MRRSASGGCAADALLCHRDSAVPAAPVVSAVGIGAAAPGVADLAADG